MSGRVLSGLVVVVLAAVGLGAGTASADGLQEKSYCSIGGTYTTSNPEVQAFLDGVIETAGGFWTVEIDNSDEEFGTAEPDETLADVINEFLGGPFDDGIDVDDIPVPFDPTGFEGIPASSVTFYPVTAGGCVPKAPPGPPGIFECAPGEDGSGAPFAIPGLDPAHPEKGDPATDAVQKNGWRYADLLKTSTGYSLVCGVPAGAKPTGLVGDNNDDEVPASQADQWHAIGAGETFAYPVFTA
jgi:hypothetical protein